MDTPAIRKVPRIGWSTLVFTPILRPILSICAGSNLKSLDPHAGTSSSPNLNVTSNQAFSRMLCQAPYSLRPLVSMANRCTPLAKAGAPIAPFGAQTQTLNTDPGPHNSALGSAPFAHSGGSLDRSTRNSAEERERLSTSLNNKLHFPAGTSVLPETSRLLYPSE